LVVGGWAGGGVRRAMLPSSRAVGKRRVARWGEEHARCGGWGCVGGQLTHGQLIRIGHAEPWGTWAVL
jgi:hypothetical protein